jgi:hypothetical protein
MSNSVDLRRPFPRSYWVVPGRFLAGFRPGSADRAVAEQYRLGLVECGIRYVLDLMEEDECDEHGDLFVSYREALCSLGRARGTDVVCERVGIRDMGVPSRETMRTILDAVDRAILYGKPVYVHCLGGRGRTGTVVGCWLARHGHAVGDAVLTMLAELRRLDAHGTLASPETSEQRDMVRDWRVGE